jgi:hypothetical protein
MIKIELVNSSNGVIRTVTDNRLNVEKTEEIKVYKTDPSSNSSSFEDIIELLEDISKDLGLELGSDFDAEQIDFYVDWGEKYQPTILELDERIKELNSEVKSLKELKKVLIENANNV